MRFGAETRIHVEVQVKFENEDKAPGLKKGGVLNVAHHTLELVCSPDAIPESLTIDLTGLELGDVIHADGIKLPEGVELGEDDPQATIASIAAPSTEEIAAPVVEEEGEEAEKTA
jgi:large subunit ribosomal protein L25